MVVDGKHQGDSLIRINSLSVDLVNGNEKKKKGEKCDHFSIRGYVAEVRKNDSKMCWPFSKDGNSNGSKDTISLLPPLHVTKFRWWRCQNCLDEVVSESAQEEHFQLVNCSNTKCNPKNNLSLMSPTGDVALLPSDSKQVLRPGEFGGKGDGPGNLSDGDHHLLTCNHKKGKETEVASTIGTGHDNGNEDNACEEIPRLISDAGDVEMVERQNGGTVALKLNGLEPIDSSEKHVGSHATADIGLSIKNVELMANNTSKVLETSEKNPVDRVHKELQTVCGTSETVGVIDGTLAAAGNHTSKHSSPRTEKNSNDPLSESEGDFDEDNLQFQLHDISHGIHPRKVRKVRMLTELLCVTENQNIDHLRVEDAPSSSSFGTDMLSRTQGELAFRENDKRDFTGLKRKKNLPLDEDWRPPVINCPKSVNKKGKAFKAHAETTTTCSKPKNSAFGEFHSLVVQKNSLDKHEFDGNHIPNGFKKIKRTPIDDGLSLPGSLKELAYGKNQIKTREGDESTNTDPTSAYGTLTRNVMSPLLKSLFPPQRTERRSTCKRKNKIRGLEKLQAPPMPWNAELHREGLPTGQNTDSRQTDTGFVSWRQLLDQKSEWSSEKYSAAQRNDRKYTQFGWPDSLLTYQDSISRPDHILSKDVGIKYIGSSNVPSKTAGNAIHDTGKWCDFSKRNDRTSFEGLQQNWTPLVEERNYSLHRKKNLRDTNTINEKKTSGVQEKLEGNKQCSDKRCDKSLDRNIADDIPMEIVELLAKNQYERRLHDAKSNQFPLTSTYNPKNGEILDFATMPGNGIPRLLQERSSYGLNSRCSNGRKDLFSRTDHVPVSQCSHMGQLAEFHAYGKGSGIQVPATCLSRHKNGENSKLGDSMKGCSSSPTGFQAYKGYSSSPKQPERTGIPSFTLLSDDRLHQGRNGHRISSAPSVNKDAFLQYPGSLPKGKTNSDHYTKFMSECGSDLEGQKWYIHPESIDTVPSKCRYSCSHAGTEPFSKITGSLDVYTNETIPAMHLLSLMDAGMQSSATLALDGNSELLRMPPTYAQNHQGSQCGATETSAGSMWERTPDYNTKNHISERSRECFPAVPSFGTPPSLYHNLNSMHASGFRGHLSPLSKERGKAKCSYLPPQNNKPGPFMSAPRSAGLTPSFESFPSHNLQKGFAGASNMMAGSSQFGTVKTSTRCTESEVQIFRGPPHPVGRSVPEICNVNRNPADFSLPEAGNVFTIGAADLEFGRSHCVGSGCGNGTRRRKRHQNALASMRGYA